ncbi:MULTISPECIES: hypothetical protein [unclassified Variovorax]|uniref:hypothetical protein n=1 Tax=unclassified Variovorax TaxID=663243 RepID=UPI003F4687DE
MSVSSLCIVATAFFALGAVWFTGKALSVRAAGTPPAHIGARPGPVATRERIDLRQPLRALAVTHGATLAQRGIGLDLRLPEDPLPVAVIAGDLPQLMAHIADAAAATLPQGTTLHVLARAEGHQAVISWREATIGSDSDTDAPRLSHAFETSASRTATPRIHACRAIVARHGARIYTAPSPLGDGCLTLRFPLYGDRAARAPKGLL